MAIQLLQVVPSKCSLLAPVVSSSLPHSHQRDLALAGRFRASLRLRLCRRGELASLRTSSKEVRAFVAPSLDPWVVSGPNQAGLQQTLRAVSSKGTKILRGQSGDRGRAAQAGWPYAPGEVYLHASLCYHVAYRHARLLPHPPPSALG